MGASEDAISRFRHPQRFVARDANAANAGLTLNPTRLVVFGNPNIGTPLMQTSATAGIDLPLKILVWEDSNGDVFVSTNETRYLEHRHGLRWSTSAPSTAR